MAKRKKTGKQTVKFRYIFNDNYNTKYANGAYGGITPKGEITINFYCERGPIPNSVVHEIEENGTLSGVVNTDPEDHSKMFVRVVEQGIIINGQTAKDIITWLQDKVNLLEGTKNKENGNSNRKK